MKIHRPNLIGRGAAAVIAKAAHRQFRALQCKDYPRDGLCSQFGVSESVEGYSVSLMTKDSKFLVCVYLTSGVGERLAVFWDLVQEKILRALRAKCVDKWNGGDGMTGVSFVLSIPPPPSLLRGISNYMGAAPKLGRNTSKTTEARFKAFDDWMEKSLEEVRG